MRHFCADPKKTTLFAHSVGVILAQIGCKSFANHTMGIDKLKKTVEFLNFADIGQTNASSHTQGFFI
jgi:hypothetical protein